MQADLSNIYAKIRQICDESITIAYAQPPTYLAKIIGAEESVAKILFLYYEDRKALRTGGFISPSKLKLKQVKEADEINLTGSPLKDDCLVDVIDDSALIANLINTNPWTLNEECQKGMEMSKALRLIAKKEFQYCEMDAEKGSIWFLCDAGDTDKTILLQYEFHPGNKCFGRGFVRYLGCKTPCSISMQSMLQQHALVMRGSHETTIENVYVIKTNISIGCTWTTTTAIPSLTDLKTCEVILTQKFLLSDCSSLTEDLINQLRILAYIREDIIAHKVEQQHGDKDMNKEIHYRWGCGIDMEEIREIINQIMTEVSDYSEDENNKEIDHDLESVLQRRMLRRPSDLTDRIWETIKRCSSYKDLKLAFNILFQCAARCNIVNAPTNNNRLAKTITEIANHRLAIPNLTGTEPLELLLEIGLEKLQKDYEFIFTQSKLCCLNLLKYQSNENDTSAVVALPNVRKSLYKASDGLSEEISARKTLLHHHNKILGNPVDEDEIVGLQNSTFNAKESAQHLAKLLQIHCTLEHLLLIQTNLNLNTIYNEVCELLLQKPPRSLIIIDESLIDEIEIPLFAHDVCELLKDMDPNFRRISIATKNNFREVKSIFVYSTEYFFPPGVAECLSNVAVNAKEMEKNKVYYSWYYGKIRTFH